MFQAIVNKDQNTLRKLGIIFLKANSLPSALLCLDHCYNPPLPFDNLTVYQMADELDLFRRYAQLLLDVYTNPRPADQLGLCKLFGVLKLSDSHILLSSGSFLHRNYPNVLSGHDLQLDMMTFMRYFRARVSNRLRELVFEQNSICRGCSTFTPCLTYAVFGYCHRQTSCHNAHLSAASFSSSFYNTRLRIHLQQVLIVRILHQVYQYSSIAMVTQRRLVLCMSNMPLLI